MFSLILRPEVQQFIKDHEKEDEKKILLKHKTIFDVPASVIADQLVGRRKALSKLPVFYKAANIIYPPGLHLEQSSSEATAKFKANLIEELKPGTKSSLVDLTGGFGVDSYFFSQVVDQLIFVEENPELIEITRHNLGQLGVQNIEFHCTTAEEFLANFTTHFKWIYLDPSRRDANNKKVSQLNDCLPNVSALMDQIFEKTNNVLIKTSPLLDIQQGIKELKYVTHVFVLSVDNECKEVLFVCSKEINQNLTITAVEIHAGAEHSISFTPENEKNAVIEYAEPKKYLYEPNAALLKAGAFKYLAQLFNVAKMHPSTHLYTSDRLISDFPGRIFLVEGEAKPDPKKLRAFFPEGKANVTTRNYPLSVAELRKKTKLKDGGKKFLIGLTSKLKKHLIAASRL